MVVLKLTPLGAQDTQALKNVWKSLHSASCPYHYNFHMHTTCSDGRLTPQSLIKQAVSIGLKGMAISDHHSIGGYQVAQQWLDKQTQSSLPQLWTGVEITSHLLATEVHILGYAFEPEHPAIVPYLQGEPPYGDKADAEQVIAAIQQAGGLAVLAHPARYQLPAVDLIHAVAALGINGVEAFYAYGNPKPWQPSPLQTEQVTHLSEVYQLYRTCGTDTHGINLLQRL